MAANGSGGGSDSVVPSDSSDCTCPLCACTFKEPLELTCGHALCEQCIRSWAVKSKEMEVASVESSLDLLGLTDDDVWLIYNGRPGTGMKAAPVRPLDLRERCAFCKGVETQTDDLIFCDRCDMCVHPGCYLIQRMPAEEESWYCEPCDDAIRAEKTGAGAGAGGHKEGKASSKSSKSKKRSGSSSAPAIKPPKCSVCCNRSDRALRRVAGGGYVHLSCATFHDGPTVEVDAPVGDLDAIGRQWYKLSCQFCDGYGAAVQCSYGSCTRAYHVPCGLENGALFAIKSCPAAEGAEAETEVHRLNVCPLHRRHVRDVANAHDRRVVDVDAGKKSRKRKGSRNSSSSSSSAARAAAAHMLKVTCPTCRKPAGIDLRAPHLSLTPATALAARADAWRLAHPEEDEELMDIISKYPNSRAHDGSSSDDSDAEKEGSANGRRAAAAGSAAAAAASSAAAPAAVPASSSRSRSHASAAAAAPSRTSSRTSPARPSRAASSASASSAQPDAQRPGRGGAGVCLSPASSLARLPSPPPSGSSARANNRAARRLQVHSDEPAAPASSAAAAASSSRNAAAAASAPAAPLTPSKRKQQPSASIAAPPSRRVHVNLCSDMDEDEEEEEKSAYERTRLDGRDGESEEEEQGEDEADADMDEILRAAPSPASSSGSAMPSASLRMARSHSEPAPAPSPSDGAAAAAAANSAHVHTSPRRKAGFAAAAPASASARPQPQAASSPASRKRAPSARPASSAGMGSSSPTRRYDPHLSLEIDGLEIIECHRPAPLSSKRARVGASAPRLPSIAATAHDQAMDACSFSASAAAAAPTPHRSGPSGAGAATSSGATPMDEEQGDEDEGEDESGDGDDDDEAQRAAVEGEALARLESLDSFLKQQMMNGEFLPPNDAAAAASPASSAAAAAAAGSSLVAVAPLSAALRSHLHSVRSALRSQQSLLTSSSLSSSLRARVPMVIDSLDTLLQSLLKQYLPHAALTRRSARNKTAVAQQIDNIVAAAIDPMLAIHQ